MTNLSLDDIMGAVETQMRADGLVDHAVYGATEVKFAHEAKTYPKHWLRTPVYRSGKHTGRWSLIYVGEDAHTPVPNLGDQGRSYDPAYNEHQAQIISYHDPV